MQQHIKGRVFKYIYLANHDLKQPTFQGVLGWLSHLDLLFQWDLGVLQTLDLLKTPLGAYTHFLGVSCPWQREECVVWRGWGHCSEVSLEGSEHLSAACSLMADDTYPEWWKNLQEGSYVVYFPLFPHPFISESGWVVQ